MYAGATMGVVACFMYNQLKSSSFHAKVLSLSQKDAIRVLFDQYATTQPDGSKKISIEGVRALMGSVSEEKVLVGVLYIKKIMNIYFY